MCPAYKLVELSIRWDEIFSEVTDQVLQVMTDEELHEWEAALRDVEEDIGKLRATMTRRAHAYADNLLIEYMLSLPNE